MSAELRTVILPSEEEVTYDADMPIGAIEAIQEAAESGKLGALRVALSSFVSDWTFEGDPSDPESWKALRRSTFAEVVQGIMGDLGDQGN